MTTDATFIEHNDRERERLRLLVARLSDDELRRSINEQWTVAGVLGHAAFWDQRMIVLADKFEGGVPFTPSDVEPDDPNWINDTMRPLLHAIAPRDAAELALRIAVETDRRMAAIDPARMWPLDQNSLLNPLRAEHRREHLDEIEAALERGSG